MALVLNTSSEAAVSAEFAPTEEFNIQSDADSASVLLEVHAKVDAAASFEIIDTFQPALTPVRRYVQFAAVKVGIRGNASGATINVWRS